MKFNLSGGFMLTQQNSSPTGTRSGLGLSPHEHGAIASAIAPLMVLFVNVAAPRPANAQCSQDNKAKQSMLYAPQAAPLALAAGDLPPVLKLHARRAPRRRTQSSTPRRNCRRCSRRCGRGRLIRRRR